MVANSEQETQGGLVFVPLKEDILKIPSDDSNINQDYKPLN